MVVGLHGLENDLAMSVVEEKVGSQKVVPADGDLLQAPAKVEDDVIQTERRRKSSRGLPDPRGRKVDIHATGIGQRHRRQSWIERGPAHSQVGGSLLRVFPGHARCRVVALGNIHQLGEGVDLGGIGRVSRRGAIDLPRIPLPRQLPDLLRRLRDLLAKADGRE